MDCYAKLEWGKWLASVVIRVPLMALRHSNEGAEEIDSGGSRNVSDTWSHETVSAEGDEDATHKMYAMTSL
jgi:hypothetical protein